MYILTHPIVRCIFVAAVAVVYVGGVVAVDDHWPHPFPLKSAVAEGVVYVVSVVEFVVVYSAVLFVYSFVWCVVVEVVSVAEEVCQNSAAVSCSVECYFAQLPP